MDCSMCLNSIRDTGKSLLCGHTFCRRCVSTLIINAGGRSHSVSISCPQCRRPSRSGSGDIRDIFVGESTGDGDTASLGDDRSTENEHDHDQVVEQDHDVDVDAVNDNFGITRGDSPVATDSLYVSPFPSGDGDSMREDEYAELRTALILSQHAHGHNRDHDHAHDVHGGVRGTFLLAGPPEFLPFHPYVQVQNHGHAPGPTYAHTADGDAALQAARRRIRNLEADLIGAQEHWVHAQSLVNRARREIAKKDERIRELEAAMARVQEAEWWRAVMAHGSASSNPTRLGVPAPEGYWSPAPLSPVPLSPVYPHSPWGQSAQPTPVIPRGYTLNLPPR